MESGNGKTPERFNASGIYKINENLWIWRARHPFWTQNDDYQPIVTSVLVKTKGESVLIDPLAPSMDNLNLWDFLDRESPTMVISTMPDHVRDLDMFAKRYDARVYGPLFFFKDQVPVHTLLPCIPGIELPGGILPLYDARGRGETPLFIRKEKIIVFGDALMESHGVLRVWDSPMHKRWELPALRDMLSLDFDHVIISHCDKSPWHTREEFENALELEPFSWPPPDS